MALTPEALISSLQEHLAQHATLLPALHAQLGLPASILTMELEQLQDTLRGVVEGQITKRRQEVDEWMGKCDAAERECIELVASLGGNTRNLQSVGELRKVQVSQEIDFIEIRLIVYLFRRSCLDGMSS